MGAETFQLLAVHTVDCSVLANLSEDSVEDCHLSLVMALDWVGYYCNLNLLERSVAVVVQDSDLMFVLVDIVEEVDIVGVDSFAAQVVNNFLALAVGWMFGHNCLGQDSDCHNRMP